MCTRLFAVNFTIMKEKRINHFFGNEEKILTILSVELNPFII